MGNKALYLLLLATLAAGYLLGTWMQHDRDSRAKVTTASSEKKPRFYRHPMTPDVISDHPQKDDMGMDYIPVFDEAPEEGSPKILYYRNPMNPEITSPEPMKDSMGMDYIPVYDDESTNTGRFRITPEKIQKLGVQTEIAQPRRISVPISAVGKLEIDEGQLHVISPRFEGWINRVMVNTTGALVRKGDALLQLYSPSILASEEEYLVARSNQARLENSTSQSRDVAAELTRSALERLRLWKIPEIEIQRLQTTGKASINITLFAPSDGTVIEKPTLEGMRFMPGEILYKIANLKTIWMMAEVFEQDIARVRVGQPVTLVVNGYPEQAFVGKVSFIYPILSPETRTVRVRIEMANPQGMLKPAMFGNVTIQGVAHDAVVTIPESGVLDTGRRQIAFVRLQDRGFEPRELRLGARGDGYVEVIQGIDSGEAVVVGANFLIDAESNLKAAVQGMGSKLNEDQKINTGESSPSKHEGQ